MENFKAIIQVLRASRKTYWYKDKKGKQYTAILVKDSIFASSKVGLAWRILKRNNPDNGCWIQIKDAKLIKWI